MNINYTGSYKKTNFFELFKICELILNVSMNINYTGSYKKTNFFELFKICELILNVSRLLI